MDPLTVVNQGRVGGKTAIKLRFPSGTGAVAPKGPPTALADTQNRHPPSEAFPTGTLPQGWHATAPAPKPRAAKRRRNSQAGPSDAKHLAAGDPAHPDGPPHAAAPPPAPTAEDIEMNDATDEYGNSSGNTTNSQRTDASGNSKDSKAQSARRRVRTASVGRSSGANSTLRNLFDNVAGVAETINAMQHQLHETSTALIQLQTLVQTQTPASGNAPAGAITPAGRGQSNSSTPSSSRGYSYPHVIPATDCKAFLLTTFVPDARFGYVLAEGAPWLRIAKDYIITNYGVADYIGINDDISSQLRTTMRTNIRADLTADVKRCAADAYRSFSTDKGPLFIPNPNDTAQPPALILDKVVGNYAVENKLYCTIGNEPFGNDAVVQVLKATAQTFAPLSARATANAPGLAVNYMPATHVAFVLLKIEDFLRGIKSTEVKEAIYRPKVEEVKEMMERSGRVKYAAPAAAAATPATPASDA